jgi:hypothetical protein
LRRQLLLQVHVLSVVGVDIPQLPMLLLLLRLGLGVGFVTAAVDANDANDAAVGAV